MDSLTTNLGILGLTLLLFVIPFYLLAYLKDVEAKEKKRIKELNKDE